MDRFHNSGDCTSGEHPHGTPLGRDEFAKSGRASGEHVTSTMITIFGGYFHCKYVIQFVMWAPHGIATVPILHGDYWHHVTPMSYLHGN
jgi:hypothetical protein